MKKEEEEEGGRSRPRIWDCGSPLYDSYELASVCRLLEQHTRALPFARDDQEDRMMMKMNGTDLSKRTKKSNIIVHKARKLRSGFCSLLGTLGLRRKKSIIQQVKTLAS